jgi:putative inorganic carbon (hco3(-)) transporter
LDADVGDRAVVMDQWHATRRWPDPLFGAATALIAIFVLMAAGKPQIALLAFGLGAALCGAALVVRRPERATWTVLALIYSNALVVGVTLHGLPSVIAVALPALLAIPLLDNIVRGRPIIVPPVSGWMLLFSAVMFASAAHSSDVARSFGEVGVFLSEGVGIYFGLVNVVRTRRQLVVATTVVATVATLVALLSVFQWLTRTYANDYLGFAQISKATITIDAAGDVQPRIAGPIGEKNRYAQMLAVVVPLAAGLAWIAPSRRMRSVWLTCAASCLMAVALTYSRGAAVGMLPILLLAARMRRARIRSIVTLCMVVALLVLSVPGYRDRLASIETVGGATAVAGEQGQTDGAIRGRVTQNIAALLGVGPGMFPAYYPSYAQDVGIRPRLVEREAHNLWLDIASDTGLLGTTAFLGLVVAVGRRLLVRYRDGDPLAAGYLLAILAYQTTGIFLHLSYARYYWLLMALATVAATVEPTADVPRRRSAEAPHELLTA